MFHAELEQSGQTFAPAVRGQGLTASRAGSNDEIAFDELAFRPPMLISLAKKEEKLFVHGRRNAIRLPRRDPALHILQAVRDEAHRFAQHYHHILRRRAMLQQQSPVRKKPSTRKGHP